MKTNTLIKLKTFLVILVAATVCGCLGPRRIDKWIASEYGPTTTLNKNKSDYINITSPLITGDEVSSKSTKKTRHFLPLLFYWKCDYRVSSTLNSKIPINTFTSAFTNYANSKGVRQKLNGSKVEISIDKIPVSFSFNDDETVVYLVFFYVDNQKIYWLPEKQEMVLTYKIINSNAAVKTGVINIPDPNKTEKPRFFESAKRATSEYLSHYDDNIRAMAKMAVDKLIADL